MDQTERRTAGLTAVYLATLSLVYVLGEPIGWLLWAAGASVVVGAMLVAFNRSTPAEFDDREDETGDE